jgi:hypothetical protein
MVLLPSFADNLCVQHSSPFKALLVKTMYLHWSAYRFCRTKSAVSPSILLRVAAFSLFRLVVAMYNSSLASHPETLTPVLPLQRICDSVIFNTTIGGLVGSGGWNANNAFQSCSPCLG